MHGRGRLRLSGRKRRGRSAQGTGLSGLCGHGSAGGKRRKTHYLRYDPAGHPPHRHALRPGGRRPLRHRVCLPEVHARIRPGRGAALSGTPAGGGRPALCLPPVDGVRLRGRGACLSANHPYRQGGGGCRQHGGSAGGASAACGCSHSGGHQPQIQQRPRCHQRSHCGCAGRAHRTHPAPAAKQAL